MTNVTNRTVKAQEWIIRFDGRVKRTEKIIYLDQNEKIMSSSSKDSETICSE